MGLLAGAAFGHYRVIEQLGKGGMATVYKAYESSLDRYIALKILPAEFLHEETFAERFEREAKVIARLEHPNIIPIFNFGIETGTPWMAMRLIAGGTLSALLKQRRLSYEEIVRIIRGVAEALEYAHDKGVMHRDVKPQNVLLDEAGRVYLADFGIAKMVEGSSGLTATGMISGTPYYMAPEQATGGSPLDHRCDIYALGVITYEMLMGRVPFMADTPVAVLMKQVSEPIPLPSSNEVPEPLFRAVLKALAKKPEDRWPRATEFARALEAGLSEMTSAAGPPMDAPRTVPIISVPTSVAPGIQQPAVARRGTAAAAHAPPIPPPVPPPTQGSGPPTRYPPPTYPQGAAPTRSSAGPTLAIVGILGVLVLGAAAAGGWWFLRSRSETAAGPGPGGAGSLSPPPVATTEPARVAPPPATGAETPPTTAAAPPFAGPLPIPIRRAAATPAAAAPPVATTPAVSAAPAGPSLDLEVEVVQDRGGPWSSPELYLKVKLDDTIVKDAPMVFGDEARKSEHVLLPDVRPGPHRLLVAVSKTPTMTSDATAHGTKEITISEGVNRLGVQVRFLGPDDWTIRFR